MVVPDERFEDHLLRPRGRGRAVGGGAPGVAGGAACGDLVRVSVAVEGDRSREAGFEASGCGSMVAAASAAVELVAAAGLLDAARIGSPRSPPSSAVSAPASCTRPISPPMRCTARSARP